MSRRGKKAPALGWRSLAAFWKTMAAESNSTMQRISGPARGAPGCGCALRYQAKHRKPKWKNSVPKQNNRHPKPTDRQKRLTMKQKSKPQQATDKTGTTHGKCHSDCR